MSKSIGRVFGTGSMSPYGYETDYMQYLRGYNPYNYEQTLQNMMPSAVNVNVQPDYQLSVQTTATPSEREKTADTFSEKPEEADARLRSMLNKIIDNVNQMNAYKESLYQPYNGYGNSISDYNLIPDMQGSDYVDMNKGQIVPYTRMNGSIGYDLIDTVHKPAWNQLQDSSTYKNMNFIKNMAKYYGLTDIKQPIYDAGNKDITRNVWEQLRQQCLRPYDNYLSGEQRIEQLRNGNNLFLDVEYNPQANYDIPLYGIAAVGKHYVDKYGEIIDKYAQKYNMDADLVKAIMYNEAATGHDFGANYYRDLKRISNSQMPMNIRGDIWSNFDGKKYDTYNPEENIMLSIQLLKRLQNSLHNPTPDKIGTLWNETGAMQINDYGARTKTIYDTKPWNKDKSVYQIIGEKIWGD